MLKNATKLFVIFFLTSYSIMASADTMSVPTPTTKTLPDGSIEADLTAPDGSSVQSIRHPDGTIQSTVTDPHGIQTVITKHPDGTIDKKVIPKT